MASSPLAYYPGCSGLGTSMEYDRSTRAVCEALGIPLKDIPDWSCCGSTPAHTVDHALSTALSARNLIQAETIGLSDIATPCPSCLKNLKTAMARWQDPKIGPAAEKLLGKSLQERHRVRSVLQVLYEELGPEALAAKVSRPLAGLKVVPYYGCLMTRPKDLMDFDDEEYPVSMDRLLEAAGAEVLPFPLKVECCGASMGIPLNKAVTRLSGKILELAASLGADAVAVACPLCQMNLDLRQGQVEKANHAIYKLPVFYYTQLLGLALGLPERDLGLSKLNVNPEPALALIRQSRPKPAAETAATTEDAA